MGGCLLRPLLTIAPSADRLESSVAEIQQEANSALYPLFVPALVLSSDIKSTGVKFRHKKLSLSVLAASFFKKFNFKL